MRRKMLEDLPHDARAISGLFSGETEAGVPFQVRKELGSRSMRSNELMRAVINSQVRGMPLTNARVQEEHLFLEVSGRPRVEIEITPSNMYRYGRRIDRSLRALVTQVMDDMGVDLSPPPAPRF